MKYEYRWYILIETFEVERRAGAKMKNVKVIYNHNGYITYKKGKIEVTTILYGYDDALDLIGFKNGLLTIMMKRGDNKDEEYVDFGYALSMLNLANEKSAYFDGVNVGDLVLEKE